jgi:phosphohistidine phosphatase
MRRLLLLRHGKAERHSTGGDRDRPLTSRGEDDSRRLGHYMAAEIPAPDLAISSNARRAQQTLDLALRAFPRPTPHSIDDALYLASVDQLLEKLQETPDEVTTLLIVGHNPGFGELAIALAGAGAPRDLADLQMKFPTCALAVLEFEGNDWARIEKGAGRLARLVTPARLRGDPADESE